MLILVIMDTKLTGAFWDGVLNLSLKDSIRDPDAIETTSYIVFSNFATIEDPLTDKIMNQDSGISEQAFEAIVADYCKRFDLEIVKALDDTYVLSGDEAAYEAVKLENDRRFSHAFIDDSGYEAMMDAEEEYAFDVATGTHVPSDNSRRIEAPLLDS